MIAVLYQERLDWLWC